MKMKKRVVKQIKEMTAEFNADALNPCEVANVGFATLPSFAKACQEAGEVYLKACAEKSYATGKGLEAAVVSEKATASVFALDHRGKPYTSNVDRITCELISEKNAKMIQLSIKKVKDNQYEVGYCPTSRGRHQLHIKFEGVHIKASPFAVNVRRSFEKVGTPIMTITGLNQPWGVVVNEKGEIIIAEYGADRVSVYSQTGEKLRSFGLRGNRQGQFRGPRGVAVDEDDNILVADSEKDRIQKFTSDGQFITAVGRVGKQPLQFNTPTGIAIHPVSKRVYVSEAYNHRVQILNPNLTPHSRFKFGSRGSGKGQFQYPRGIAFDSAQNVYVGENEGNAAIQVFSAEGEHLRWLGVSKLNKPHDVSIDSSDTVYVCDTDNHRIVSLTLVVHSFIHLGQKGHCQDSSMTLVG